MYQIIINTHVNKQSLNSGDGNIFYADINGLTTNTFLFLSLYCDHSFDRLKETIKISFHTVWKEVKKMCHHRLSFTSLFYVGSFTGLQLRKSERNGFHDKFLISQPYPIM